MVYIAHRGNVNGKNLSVENLPEQIIFCLNNNLNVEIDVWLSNNQLFLGHDREQYPIDIEFLKNKNLWCHAKNVDCLNLLLSNNIHCFWHQNDDYTITSRGYIWVYPNKKLIKNCIAVMPEQTKYTLNDLKMCYAICSDNIEYYKQLLG